MSYEMQYHPNMCKQFTISKRRNGTVWGVSCLLVVAVLALIMGSRTSDLWWKFMIPGETTKTISAVEAFAENLKTCDSFESAFRSFCVEIVSIQ